MRSVLYPHDRSVAGRLRTGGVAVLIGLLGFGAIRAGSAATYSVPAESETAQVTGRGAITAAADASAGSAVRFGDTGPTGPRLDDSFDDQNLASYWQYAGTTDQPAPDVLAGRLRMRPAAGSDQWVNIDRAPKLLKPAPAGENWSIETRLSENTGPAQSFASLVVYKDAANWIGWGQLGANRLIGSGVIKNTARDDFASMASKFEYLRLRRDGSSYLLDASLDGKTWNNANSFVDEDGSLNGARVGFMAKSWGAGYTAGFDYYREYDYDVMPSQLTTKVVTTQVSKQTGWDAINDTRAANFCGTDLGAMFRWQNRTYSVFGDTNRCDNRPWPSNVMSYSTDTNPADGIKYDGWVGGGRELFTEEPGNVTAIPTDGIGIGNTAYIYYMNINNWSPPAPDKWTCTSASIATATSADHATWTKRQGQINWAGNSNFALIAAHQIGDEVYIWGVPCGRFGSVKLMKVPADSLLNKGAYRYLSSYQADGSPVWSTSEAAAISVAGGPTGELSVVYNRWLGRYVMAYLDERKAAIVMRESATPWGSWSAPVTLATGAQYPQPYGGYMDEAMMGGDGREVYWMLSRFGPYNTYLMKSTLTKR